MLVLALVVLRLAWRLFDKRPPHEAMPRWMDLASNIVQVGLYVLLFAIPFTAIAGAWLEGHPLTLLAGIRIAPWFGPSPDLGAWIANLHTWLGLAIMWLAGLHALAGIFHHLVMKDGVLRSMFAALAYWMMPARANELRR